VAARIWHIDVLPEQRVKHRFSRSAIIDFAIEQQLPGPIHGRLLRNLGVIVFLAYLPSH
jgi:hypothetical protein